MSNKYPRFTYVGPILNKTANIIPKHNIQRASKLKMNLFNF